MRLLVPHLLMLVVAQTINAAELDPPSAGQLLDRVIALNQVEEPELDAGKLRNDIVALCAEARQAVDAAATTTEKIAALDQVLLERRNVTYLSNVYWRDSTLASCVERRAGNCISTSTLFALVGDMLGLPVHLVMLPNHAFVRWDGSDGHVNIETTNPGADFPDAYYLKDIDGEDRELLHWGESLDRNGLLGILTVAAARHCLSQGNLVQAQHFADQYTQLLPWRVDLQLEQIEITSDLTKDRPATRLRLNALLQSRMPRSVATSALLWLAGDAGARRKPLEQRGILMHAYRIAPRESQYQVLMALAFCHRALRDHGGALLYYELAIEQPWTSSTPSDHNLYGMAILLKEVKRLGEAQAMIDRALAVNPESWNLKVLKAGYLCLDGHLDQGKALFATIEKPRDQAQFWADMRAWFFAVSGQQEEFYHAFSAALHGADDEHILLWIEQDESLDPFRGEAEFRTLLEEQRERILGEKPSPGSP